MKPSKMHLRIKEAQARAQLDRSIVLKPEPIELQRARAYWQVYRPYKIIRILVAVICDDWKAMTS
jgi:hypothetical protein